MAAVKIVVPWHNHDQKQKFLDAWGITQPQSYLQLQQDKDKSGCALTKNRGIEKAISSSAEYIIILDDDCYPTIQVPTLATLISDHISELNKTHSIELFDVVTAPASRGTPYHHRSIEMRVEASMGFWTHVGDYDAIGQLTHGATHPMEFDRSPRFGKYFPLCGMNLAFRASSWPWCQFIDVPRFDDIWQGFLWQRKAYDDHKCFSLNGPTIKHSRQSNVWQNLRDEAVNMERNETLWRDIATAPAGYNYDSLKALI